MNTLQTFTRQIEAAQRRAQELRTSARQTGRAAGGESAPVMEEAFAELSATLEELRVAEEELRVQNEDLVAARELTERQRQRYQDLFDLAPDGYLVTDQYGAIREANLAAADMLGVLREHLTGKPMVVFVPEQERQSFREGLSSLAQQRRLEGWELGLLARDAAAVRRLLVTAESGADTLTHQPVVRWTLRDITERRRLEARVRDMDDKLWVRVAERTAALANENDRMRAELGRLRGPSAEAGKPGTDQA
jgi:PAS domain S-box-containing protein